MDQYFKAYINTIRMLKDRLYTQANGEPIGTKFDLTIHEFEGALTADNLFIDGVIDRDGKRVLVKFYKPGINLSEQKKTGLLKHIGTVANKLDVPVPKTEADIFNMLAGVGDYADKLSGTAPSGPASGAGTDEPEVSYKSRGIFPILVYSDPAGPDRWQRSRKVKSAPIPVKIPLEKLFIGKMQFYPIQRLSFCILDSKLMPKVKIVDDEEKASILEKYNKLHIPQIRADDPLVKYLGLNVGDIVAISRRSAEGSGIVWKRVIQALSI